MGQGSGIFGRPAFLNPPTAKCVVSCLHVTFSRSGGQAAGIISNGMIFVKATQGECGRANRTTLKAGTLFSSFLLLLSVYQVHSLGQKQLLGMKAQQLSGTARADWSSRHGDTSGGGAVQAIRFVGSNLVVVTRACIVYGLCTRKRRRGGVHAHMGGQHDCNEEGKKKKEEKRRRKNQES